MTSRPRSPEGPGPEETDRGEGAAGGPTGGAAARSGRGERDRRWMDRALELAGRGWGRVEPNPMVGAVVVRGDRAVGEGHHREYGGPHAEVLALEEAGDAARGGTLYVTLEPCTHHGKTRPCTDAILRSGVSRVVVACRDPHREAGGGAEELSRRGVQVRTGVRAERARAQIARFLWREVTGRTWVTLKYGLSLDARLARREGEQTRVTGREAHEEVHRLRAGYDAILVGRRTATVDDPLLTPRGSRTPRVPPVRIVLDPVLRLPTDARLVRTADRSPVWAVASPDASREDRERVERRGVRVVELPATGPGRIDLGALTEFLAEEGVGTLLVEGGGRVGASFLSGGHVHRMQLFYAPRVFGQRGVPAFPDPAPGAGGSESSGWMVARRAGYGRDTLLVLDRREVREELREVC